MKKFISIVFMTLLITALSSSTFAAEIPYNEIDSGPLHTEFVNIRLLQAGLSIDSSGLTSCTGQVILYNSSDNVNLSVALQKYTGSSWSTIKTWSTTGYGTTPTIIVESYYVVRGEYRVSTTAKVYNSSGALLETQTAYSATRSY